MPAYVRWRRDWPRGRSALLVQVLLVQVLLGQVLLVLGPLQRKRRAFIERVDFLNSEPGLVDLQIGAEQRRRRDVLDREAHRFRRSIEPHVTRLGSALLDPAWEQLRRSAVI